MMWRSATRCQPPETVVVAVAGVAGSGKSTLGRALALALGAPLLDLDSLTNPLLDALPADALGGHWLASPHSTAIRDGRYAALRSVASDTLATAGRAVLVAPFTEELRGGEAWTKLLNAIGASTNAADDAVGGSVGAVDESGGAVGGSGAAMSESAGAVSDGGAAEGIGGAAMSESAGAVSEGGAAEGIGGAAMSESAGAVSDGGAAQGIGGAVGGSGAAMGGIDGAMSESAAAVVGRGDAVGGSDGAMGEGGAAVGGTGRTADGSRGAGGGCGGSADGNGGAAVGAAVRLHVVHLTGDDELFGGRRAGRAASRDRHRTGVPAVAPAVPVISIDAELSTGQQLLRVLAALGHRAPVDASNALLAADFDAVLFDLDGTLADSTASVLRSWRRFAGEWGVPVEAVARNHGRPARELIAMLVPADRTTEGLARITELEIVDAISVRPAPGALELFTAVPEDRRAIVTSGSKRLATARLRAARLPVPAIMVTADDVSNGKPDPEPFLLGAKRLGADPSRCLAVEDTPAGIRSARAAGCLVLAVTGTSAAGELAEADLIVDGLDRLALDTTGGVLRLVGARR